MDGRLVVDDITIEMPAKSYHELDFILGEAHRFNQSLTVVRIHDNGDETRVRIDPTTDLDLYLVRSDPTVSPYVAERVRFTFEDELYDARRSERAALVVIDSGGLYLDSE